MTGSQVVLLTLIALVLFFYLRRFLLTRVVVHYTPTEIAEKVRNGSNVVLLDVRTPGERISQHISGSVHIPMHELRYRIEELRKYQSSEIICYCRSGNRSLVAARLLRKQGFNAANMKGGIAEWNFRGLR